MEPIASVALSLAVKTLVGKLAGEITDELLKKVKGDPVNKAFKKALGAAIQRYAKGDRLALARPLLEKDGLLTDSEVAQELSKLIRFEGNPDVNLIGKKW